MKLATKVKIIGLNEIIDSFVKFFLKNIVLLNGSYISRSQTGKVSGKL